MAEYFCRELAGESRRLVGPFESEEEAGRAARYKGLGSVEILKKNGANYEALAKPR